MFQPLVNFDLKCSLIVTRHTPWTLGRNGTVKPPIVLSDILIPLQFLLKWCDAVPPKYSPDPSSLVSSRACQVRIMLLLTQLQVRSLLKVTTRSPNSPLIISCIRLQYSLVSLPSLDKSSTPISSHHKLTPSSCAFGGLSAFIPTTFWSRYFLPYLGSDNASRSLREPLKPFGMASSNAYSFSTTFVNTKYPISPWFYLLCSRLQQLFISVNARVIIG